MLVLSIACFACRACGAGSSRGVVSRVYLEHHTLCFVPGDGAIALGGFVDDARVELNGLAWLHTAGLVVTNLQVVDLVAVVGEVDHQVGALWHVNGGRDEGHAGD